MSVRARSMGQDIVLQPHPLLDSDLQAPPSGIVQVFGHLLGVEVGSVAVRVEGASTELPPAGCKDRGLTPYSHKLFVNDVHHRYDLRLQVTEARADDEHPNSNRNARKIRR